MFDIAWSELALIGAVALIVIGPKDLPKVMRVMGQWTRKARLLAGEFQSNFDELLRQAELDEVRQQVQSVNPGALKEKVENMIDAKAIEAALQVDPQNVLPTAPVSVSAPAVDTTLSEPAVSVPTSAPAAAATLIEPAAASTPIADPVAPSAAPVVAKPVESQP
ncbi:MAG TPA: Sec-independent protein translocase protein TatB [Telmatospirillum sp.]|nr:Sec-independent protein translocase protein TatB [Telmatospirillum sp.]